MTPEERFKKLHPEFKDETDEDVGFWFAEAARLMNQEIWGDNYAVAMMARAAHEWKLAMRAADDDDPGAGTVTSISSGNHSVSFQGAAGNPQDDAYFNSTSYGKKYLNLRRGLALGGRMVF